MFVFGDAAVDVGNSNFLNSRARANYYPYGVDFSGGASGRSTNGKTFADLLGEWLGMPAPPPFADPNTRTGNRILGGVNYASAGAGILEETGQHYQERYTLSQQVVNFESTLNQLRTMMSPADLNTYLARSIAVVVIGSNDYVNNYLLPSLYTSSFNYNPAQFADLLLNRYARQLVALYSVGLRKFYLAGIGPLGCTPNQLATGQAQSGRCVDSVNQMLGSFNGGLRALVDNLNNGGHPGAVYVYGNTYGIMGDMLNNRARYDATPKMQNQIREAEMQNHIREEEMQNQIKEEEMQNQIRDVKSNSKALLDLEDKSTPSASSLESKLNFCNGDESFLSRSTKLNPHDKKPAISSIPQSQFLGNVKDFLGVISEENKNLELDAKTILGKNHDIEALTGEESEYIEMDLMLGGCAEKESEAEVARRRREGWKGRWS
nr:GDSL esterase/lipase At1g71250 [Ipomoea batatas]